MALNNKKTISISARALRARAEVSAIIGAAHATLLHEENDVFYAALCGDLAYIEARRELILEKRLARRVARNDAPQRELFAQPPALTPRSEIWNMSLLEAAAIGIKDFSSLSEAQLSTFSFLIEYLKKKFKKKLK